MRKLILISTIFLINLTYLDSQVITHLTGFDLNMSSDKNISEVIRLDDNIGLAMFSTPKMLWRTDGTKAGSFLLHNWEDEISSNDYRFWSLVGIANDKAIMLVNTDSTGKELWVSDGTVNGTHLLVDFVPGDDGIYYDKSTTNKFVTFEDNCYLVVLKDYMFHIMKTDGTVAGTEIFIENIIPLSFTNTSPPNLFLIDDYFYFVWSEKLYKINKDTKVISTYPLNTYYRMHDIKVLNDSSLLLAIDDNSDGHVVNYNLNNKSVELLAKADFTFAYFQKLVYQKIFTPFNNKYYFTVDMGLDNIMYSTNGTLAGTKQIGTFNNRLISSFEYNDKLWFDIAKGQFGIYSMDKNETIKAEVLEFANGFNEERSLILLNNNKFLTAGSYQSTNNDNEPHLFDPITKTLTKIANLNNSGGSFPKLMTKLKDDSYLFYATDTDFEGSLYSLKLNATPTKEVLDLTNIKAINNITNDKWNILFEDYKSDIIYNLFNTEGTLVKTENISTKEFAIDARDLSNGIYFLNVGSASLKLIKQ